MMARISGREAVWATRAEDVFIGQARKHEIRVLDRTGTLKKIVRWSAENEAVTEEEWSYYVAQVLEHFRENPEDRQYEPAPDIFERPKRKPPYSAVFVDPIGRIWVQQYGRYGAYAPEPSEDWWLFDAGGQWIANVSAPPGLEVITITRDHLIGLFRDELDVEHIRMHRILTTSESP